jgi:hypothetical protein
LRPTEEKNIVHFHINAFEGQTQRVRQPSQKKRQRVGKSPHVLKNSNHSELDIKSSIKKNSSSKTLLVYEQQVPKTRETDNKAAAQVISLLQGNIHPVTNKTSVIGDL